MKGVSVSNFSEWRDKSRVFVANRVEPEEIMWLPPGRSSIFQTPDTAGEASSLKLRVPKKFVDIAATVSLHSDDSKWSLLYRLLWRLCYEQPKLLEIPVDPDVHGLLGMEREVKKDIHKMHAFVRFRQVSQAGSVMYVAWYRPDHDILEAAVPFFVRRFRAQQWTILTPSGSAIWDGEELHFGPGVAADPIGDEDPGNEISADGIEDLWRVYYGSTFNPARIRLKAMKAEMPKRFWKALPESRVLPQLIRESEMRVKEMGAGRNVNEVELPAARSFQEIHDSADCCRRCPIGKMATQAVVGEGPKSADIVFVGEQPGDDEDLRGKPFVGPAGRLLDKAFEEAGIERRKVYVTNAVKHFKWIPKGKRRLHQKPNGQEIAACRIWLANELKLIKPNLIVCLGGTAAQSVIGRAVQVTKERGNIFTTGEGYKAFVTVHPSSILRVPDEKARKEAYESLVRDLRAVLKVNNSIEKARHH